MEIHCGIGLPKKLSAELLRIKSAFSGSVRQISAHDGAPGIPSFPMQIFRPPRGNPREQPASNAGGFEKSHKKSLFGLSKG